MRQVYSVVEIFRAQVPIFLTMLQPGALGVTGSSQLNSVTVGDTLTTTGSVTLSSTLSVSKLTNLSDKLEVTGNASLKSGLEVSGTSDFNNNLNVYGHTSLSDLTVSGETDFNDNVNIPNHTLNAKNVTISGDLSVTGCNYHNRNNEYAYEGSIDRVGSWYKLHPTNDSGILINRGSGLDNAFMGWNGSQNIFTLGTTDASGGSMGSINVTKSTLVADIVGSLSSGSADLTTLDVSGHTHLYSTMIVNKGATVGQSLTVDGMTHLSLQCLLMVTLR